MISDFISTFELFVCAFNCLSYFKWNELFPCKYMDF
jgi:hypothetical protein